MACRSIRIVSPIYRDIESFSVLRERLLAVCTSSLNGARMRFVVIDDSAGTDPDIARLRDLEDVEIVDPPFSLGHQRAIVFALRRIAATLEDHEIVVTMDADGEDQPEDLERLLAPLIDDPGASRHVMALALRTKRRETRAFKLSYRVFRVLFRALTGEVVRTGNYAAYSGWLTKQIIGHPYFDMSYSSTLISLQTPRVMVPCERGTRYAGRSSMHPGRLIAHGLSMLMPFTERIAVRALMSFSAIIATSALAALAVLAIRLFTESAVPGWATYTLLFLLTLSLIALGNFVVLFAVFSQTRAMSFANLHATSDGRSREPSGPPA